MQALARLNAGVRKQPATAIRAKQPPLANAVKKSLEEERMKWSLFRFKEEENYRKQWILSILAFFAGSKIPSVSDKKAIHSMISSLTSHPTLFQKEWTRFSFLKDFLEGNDKGERMEEQMPIPADVKEYDTAHVRLPDDRRLGLNRTVKNDRLFFSDLVMMVMDTGKKFIVNFWLVLEQEEKRGDTYSILSLLEFINHSPALTKSYGKFNNVEEAIELEENVETEDTLLEQTYKEFSLYRENLQAHQNQISTRYRLNLNEAILLYRDNFSSLQSLFHNKYDLNRFHMLLDRLSDSSHQVTLLKAHFLKMGVINEDGSNTKELMRCLSTIWDSETKELWNKYCTAIDKMNRPKNVEVSHPTKPILGPDGFLLYPLGFFKDKNPNEQVYHPTDESSYVTIPHYDTISVQPVPTKTRPASPALPEYKESDNPFFELLSELENSLPNKDEYLKEFKNLFQWNDYERHQPKYDKSVLAADWTTPVSNKKTPVVNRANHPFEAFVLQHRQAVVDRFPDFTKDQIDNRLFQEYRRFSEEQSDKYAQLGNHPNWSAEMIAAEMDKWRVKFFEKKFLSDFPSIIVTYYPTEPRRAVVRKKIQQVIGDRYPDFPAQDLANRLEESAYNRFPPRPKQNDPYTHRVSFILRCLTDPENSLLTILVNGNILPEDLTMMNDIDLMSERQKQRQREMDDIRYRENQERTTAVNLVGVPTTDYQCGKCRSRNAHYIEKQTRSADEPMTLFIRCDQCGNQWRD